MSDVESLTVLLRKRRADLLDELANIESALRRIEQGRFGVCECCGQAIGNERLALFPAARWCGTCKQDYERRRGIHLTDDVTS